MRLPGSRVPPAQSWQASDRRRSVIHIVLFSERIKTVPSWFGWPRTMVCCTRSIPTQGLRFLPMCQAHWPIGWRGFRCSGARPTPRNLKGGIFVTGPERHPPGGTVWAYVDGHPFSADVRLRGDSDDAMVDDWKTYVFGTLGRGGKGIFALDATEVDALTESNATRVFKWQFTSIDDEDLGHITGEVSVHAASNQATPVVRMNNGKYALLLGNGYKS